MHHRMVPQSGMGSIRSLRLISPVTPYITGDIFVSQVTSYITYSRLIT
ncbi:MAG: hypothetical protein BSOLF_1038 [Candidatus Carbobacillus altaicus]|uniref:Uncharacterized protein n=1 Tax=Candidatus Carbonibacillus altaicus TaxID=2163959 RepID=A0A2R6Y001_9BACL|nr:MAG: hypothetical protein BSOLF_1038 [Candidatus Carbobacillus altaicus]